MPKLAVANSGGKRIQLVVVEWQDGKRTGQRSISMQDISLEEAFDKVCAMVADMTGEEPTISPQARGALKRYEQN